MRTVSSAALLALTLLACPDPALDVDGGAADAAGDPPSLVRLEVRTPLRGPARVELEVTCDRALALELEVSTGGSFAPATLFEAASDLPTPAPVDGRIVATLVWDSVADVDGDQAATLRARWSAGGQGGVLEPATAVQVRNDPDGPRRVLAAHPSGELPTGGSSNVNNQVSVLTLDAHGGIADTGTDLTVGVGPGKVLFSPDGTLAFALNGRDSTISVLDVSEAAIAVRGEALSLAPYSFHDMAVAPDGTSLFAVAGTGPENALFEYDLAGGVPSEVRSLDLDSVSQCVTVFPRGDVIALGRGNGNGRLLELYDRRDLGLVGSFAYNGMLCSSLRVSDDGRWVVSTDALGSMQVVLIDLADPHQPSLATTINDLTAVVEAIFHPDSTALAVSTLNGNRVVPYALWASGLLTPGEPATGMALAAEMDIVRRGARRGLIAVSALTSVAMVQLNADGTATRRGTVELGDGIESAVQGIAIAP